MGAHEDNGVSLLADGLERIEEYSAYKEIAKVRSARHVRSQPSTS